LALTPADIVASTLKIDVGVVEGLKKEKQLLIKETLEVSIYQPATDSIVEGVKTWENQQMDLTRCRWELDGSEEVRSYGLRP